MIGQSPPMQTVFDLIQDVSPTETTVLITGETGTGKGLAAKAIHSNSRRCEGPFVIVNCGAIPEHLMETELFGHQKGAFTDAKETKKGRLELAHGGTLFLDEIGEISMRMQIDLLRILEDRVFYRVGGTQPIEADFRVIAATNRDLSAAIDDGIFREDLYYRLNVISFQMPALRERKEDIPLLAEHFLTRYSQETNKPMDGIRREAMDELMLYVKDNYDFLESSLLKEFETIAPVKLEATYLAWMDFRQTGLKDKVIKDTLIQKCGLGLSHGPIFGEGGSGFQRINLAAPRLKVEEAIDRLSIAFN
jgi:transcriptional regulator with GAF, ATPase, and Fis domain